MIQRETAEPVVRYLRTMTGNGELSSGEVWELANWLNQQPEKILTSWPGKPLVKALQKVFADKELTAPELEEIAGTLVAIEELWRETFTTAAVAIEEEIPSPVNFIEENKPEAPSIDIEAEMPDEGRSNTFTVDLKHHTCTCPEWMENRGVYPQGDYRRCCVHLLRAFHSLAQDQASLRRDPLFLAFIEEHSRRRKGVDLDVIWRVVVVNGTRVLYGAAPTSEWVNVFAPDDEEEYRRFGFNRKKKRWSYGERPPNVAWQIESIFSPTLPQVLMAR
ncbi:MAG TPA: hypothetical protein VM680_19345 [Verrucomicrobiae bacterium]|nr:hypothetical protein [Verrucomicrobiae bacterium]